MDGDYLRAAAHEVNLERAELKEVRKLLSYYGAEARCLLPNNVWLPATCVVDITGS